MTRSLFSLFIHFQRSPENVYFCLTVIFSQRLVTLITPVYRSKYLSAQLKTEFAHCWKRQLFVPVALPVSIRVCRKTQPLLRSFQYFSKHLLRASCLAPGACLEQADLALPALPLALAQAAELCVSLAGVRALVFSAPHLLQ